MSDDDDRTMMLDAYQQKQAAQQFKDVGGGGEEAEATMMWSPGDPEPEVDIQNAATVVMTPEMAAAAMGAIDGAEAAAKGKGKAKKAKKAKAAGGAKNSSGLGRIGALLAMGSMAGPVVIAFISPSSIATGVKIGAILMVVGYFLFGLGLMRTWGMGKLAGMLSLLFAVLGILTTLTVFGVMGVAIFGSFYYLAGLVWIFAGLWAFSRGGGAGVTTGIFSLIGGGASVGAGVLAIIGAAPGLMGILGLAALVGEIIAALLFAIAIFGKIDRNA